MQFSLQRENETVKGFPGRQVRNRFHGLPSAGVKSCHTFKGHNSLTGWRGIRMADLTLQNKKNRLILGTVTET